MAKKDSKDKKNNPEKYIELHPEIDVNVYEGSEIEEKTLDFSQRRKRAMVMRKYASKIRLAREKAKRRKASPEKLKQRAQRKALKLIRNRLSKQKKYSEMSPSEKIALDKRLSRIPKSVIQRIARKELPKVRQAEMQRLVDIGRDKNESVECPCDETPKMKRFHNLYKKEGTVNHDKRFKMYRIKDNEFFKEDLNDLFEEVFDLQESVENFIEATAVERTRDRINTEKKMDKIRHDALLKRARALDKMKSEATIDPLEREEGTDSLVKTYKRETPGQDINEMFQTRFLEESDQCPIITQQHMKAFEQFVDKMFEKYGIDFEFTKHFRERMSHERNDPCIDLKEIAQMIKKIYAKYQHGEKSLSKYADSEAVLKDLQTNLNMPIAIEYNRKTDELDVIAKTVMRKKNFRSSSPAIKV